MKLSAVWNVQTERVRLEKEHAFTTRLTTKYEEKLT
jgi:hypothetical protein